MRSTGRRTIPWVIAVGLALTLGWDPSPVRADATSSFKSGIEASDLGQWQEAEEHFRQAIAEDPRESDQRIFISGVFTRPYLPHFYLGWALFQQGTEHCVESLASWQESKAQQIVQKLRRQYQDLQKGEDVCRGIAFPQLEQQGRRELARGRSLLQGLSGDDAATLAERRSIEAALTTAAESLEQSLRREDVTGLRQAVAQATTTTERLTDWNRRTHEAMSARQEQAASRARQALEDAEQMERSLLRLLADPSYGAVRPAVLRREMLRLKMPGTSVSQPLEEQLDDLQSRAPTVTTVEGHEEVRRQAEEVAAELRALTTRLQGLLAQARIEPVDGSAAGVPTNPSSGPAAAESPSSVAAATVPEPDTAIVEGGTTGEASAVRRRQLEELQDHAEQLLNWAADVPDGGRLLQAQVARLGALLRASRTATAADDDGVVDRLRASHGALQVLLGGEALFAGNPQGAVRILELRSLPDAAWASHGYLFRAAAQFILFQRGGGRDAELERRAAADIARGLALAPDLLPEAGTFSPAFQSFFVRHASR